MRILIETAGLLDTLQDLFRRGYRLLGVNPNGGRESAAARLINILLGNDDNAGVIEMHFPAPKIVFQTDAGFAIGGADFAPRLDDEMIKNWQINFAKKGSSLAFGEKTSGNRAYLAVHGG